MADPGCGAALGHAPQLADAPLVGVVFDLEAAEALAVHPPADLSAWGNSAGWMPAGSPVVSELPRLLEIGARIQFGGWSALQETAFGAVSFVGLTMVTFGGYASYTTGRAIWGGYKEFGILGRGEDRGCRGGGGGGARALAWCRAALVV